jgi:hypothetical protein
MDENSFIKLLEQKNITGEARSNLLSLFAVSNDTGKKFLFDQISDI